MINCRNGRLRIVVLGIFVLGLAGSAAAQENDPDFWGSGTNIHYVSAEEFVCSDTSGNCKYQDQGDGFWCSPAAYEDVFAAVRLPTGAQIQGYRVVYEKSGGPDFSVRLRRGWQWGPNKGSVEIQSWVGTGTPGVASTWVNISPDHTVFYRFFNGLQFVHNSYYLWVTLPPTYSVKLRGVLVYWNRQISPAPVDPTFPDVAPGYWAFQEIEALAASGITTGYPDGTFRPTAVVTRAQMATFLARALGLHWAP